MRLPKLPFLILALSLAVLALPTVAQAKDRDGDGMADRWEKRHHVRNASADPDRDRVDNRNEFVEKTDPRRRDSDGDGWRDGREDADRDGLRNAAEDETGNDPTDRDTDDDGVRDGREQAGVARRFRRGRLVIDLARHGRLKGRVTAETEIACASEDAVEGAEGPDEQSDDDAGAESSGSADHGHGGRPPADELNDEGEDPGEDEADDPSAEDESGDDGYDWSDADEGYEDGDDEDEDDDEVFDDSEEACPAHPLRRGARIHEATLAVTAKGKAFTSIEVIVKGS